MHFDPAISSIQATDPLRFACHPGVACFNECCRELDLALSPYDVLRLRKALGMRSGSFLEKYIIISREEGQTFPLCYLTMIDDGRASCVFVTEKGCQVYGDRPGSCRVYPIGRGVFIGKNGTIEESLALVHEQHCQGFTEERCQLCAEYLDSQGMGQYKIYDDALLPLHQHPQVQAKKFIPAEKQLNQYILALYDLDRFRQLLNAGTISLPFPLSAKEMQGLTGDDAELMLLGIKWLCLDFFHD